ncbi:uncharacterized protein LOC119280303 [Triticum dicoccoides]|uniref:uncharacterized protein LOC119280303 n=1 Tax=Triticum dicoccoides TaxID=85692 RepID=UPI0018904443|nr:uncharacterized protein LOC119280303 [Triticum dicoccoides]
MSSWYHYLLRHCCTSALVTASLPLDYLSGLLALGQHSRDLIPLQVQHQGYHCGGCATATISQVWLLGKTLVSRLRAPRSDSSPGSAPRISLWGVCYCYDLSSLVAWENSGVEVKGSEVAFTVLHFTHVWSLTATVFILVASQQHQLVNSLVLRLISSACAAVVVLDQDKVTDPFILISGRLGEHWC